MLATNGLDYTALWAWTIMFARLSGLFESLPGIGTEQVPRAFRTAAVMAISVGFAFTGIQIHFPENVAEASLMIITEFSLGFLLGFLPSLILGALSLAGQVAAGSIGLAQANMIDKSIGANVSLLSRLESLVGTVIFLLIDGHHVLLRAAMGVGEDIGAGLFRPDMSVAAILLDRFAQSFELALMIAAPILVTVLVTNFVLGLITKFIPQVNIFIISLPLTIMIGLYIITYSFPSLSRHLIEQFAGVEETASIILRSRGSG